MPSPPRFLVAERLGSFAALWKLAPRERQVLEQLVRGATNQVIADACLCAKPTAGVHVHRIVKKAGLPTRPAVLAAFWGANLDRRRCKRQFT